MGWIHRNVEGSIDRMLYIVLWNEKTTSVSYIPFRFWFFNLYPRTISHCFLEREEGRGRNIDAREKDQLVVSHMHLDWGLYMSRQETEPTI